MVREGEHVSRPTALDDLVSRRICEAIEKGNTREMAARSAKIAESTLYSWLRRGRAGESPFAEFSENLKKAEAHAEGESVGIIREAASKGTWQAAAWFLERRYPKRWGAKREAPEKVSMQERVERMTPEQRRARWKEITGHDWDESRAV